MTRIRFSLGAKFKYFWFPLIIAIWTILQSMVHVWWTVYGRAMFACEVHVKRKLEFYLYMTYLYSIDECDSLALNTYTRINFNNATASSYSRFTAPLILFKEDGTMTPYMMKIYLGADALWIVTSVGLLIGIMLRLKQVSALIFYVPWIFVSVIILATDVFSTVYYVLKLPAAEMNQENSPTWFFDGLPILAIMCGRLGITCVLNVSNCVYIIWYTRVTYKQRYSEESMRRRRKPHMRRQETENRIKNWQLFYGEIDDSAENGGKSFIHDEDLTYTTTFKELEDYNHKRKKLEGSVSEHELCSTFKSSSSIQQNDQQVAENTSESKKKVQIMELVSHLPWSYLDSNKQKMATDVKYKSMQDGDRNLREMEAKDEKDTTSKKVTDLDHPKHTTIDEHEQISRF